MKRNPRLLRLLTLEDRTVPTTIQGTVFDDANQNQVFDPGESGVAGWTVFIDMNRNTIPDPGEGLAVTDANGGYMIDTTAIPTYPGTAAHFVALDLQVGVGGRWLNTTPRSLNVNSVAEPSAIRNFGVHFEPYLNVQSEGPESLVNVTTAGPQGLSLSQFEHLPQAIAADANGNYVVVWQNTVGSSTPTIVARVMNADGTPRTGELTVATANVANCNPQVAMADNGRFVVAWQSNSSALARVYNADGTPATAVITVAAGTGSSGKTMGGVAMDAAGNFAVLYKSYKLGQVIKVQRYTAAGAAVGNAIDVFSTKLVNGGTRLAMDATGRFAVSWEHAATGDPNLYVYAQKYSAAGQKVGSQILVASAPNPGIYISSMSMNRTGRFAVAWKDYFGSTLAARVYDWGTPVGGPITLVSGPNGQVGNSSSAIDSDGNVTFTWDKSEIRYRRFTAGGVLEPVSLINATTQGDQAVPSIAATGNNRFVVAWQGNGPGDDAGMFTQRFAPIAVPRPGQAGLEPSSRFDLVDLSLPPWDNKWESADWQMFDRADDRLDDEFINDGTMIRL